MAWAAGIIGLGSLFLFGLFLAPVGLQVVDLNMEWRSALVWDTALCLAFFLQHSGMLRKSFRAWLSQAIPASYHGALYTVASGAALLLLVACWQPSHIDILLLKGPVRWLAGALSLASLSGIAWAFGVLTDFDLFGTRAVLSRLQPEQPPSTTLTIRGPYRWIRHPVYLFVIVVFWASPVLSLDRIVLNVLFTIWIAIGATLEEHDLVEAFGDAYRTYQREIPMLLPLRRTPAGR
jgi:protein-S-isoprenylcysteine O-methyltransferase Ste14